MKLDFSCKKLWVKCGKYAQPSNCFSAILVTDFQRRSDYFHNVSFRKLCPVRRARSVSRNTEYRSRKSIKIIIIIIHLWWHKDGNMCKESGSPAFQIRLQVWMGQCPGPPGPVGNKKHWVWWQFSDPPSESNPPCLPQHPNLDLLVKQRDRAACRGEYVRGIPRGSWGWGYAEAPRSGPQCGGGAVGDTFAHYGIAKVPKSDSETSCVLNNWIDEIFSDRIGYGMGNRVQFGSPALACSHHTSCMWSAQSHLAARSLRGGVPGFGVLSPPMQQIFKIILKIRNSSTPIASTSNKEAIPATVGTKNVRNLPISLEVYHCRICNTTSSTFW